MYKIHLYRSSLYILIIFSGVNELTLKIVMFKHYHNILPSPLNELRITHITVIIQETQILSQKKMTHLSETIFPQKNPTRLMYHTLVRKDN